MLKRFVCVVMACVCLAGCAGESSSSTTNPSAVEQPSTLTPMTIYQTDLNAFDRFMDNHSLDILKAEENYTYPGEEPYYFSWGCCRLEFDDELIRFATDGLAGYLSDNHINGDIIDHAMFEAPHMPITIWVKTTQGDVFVTVNEQPTDDDYTYRLYTDAEYTHRFQRKEAALYASETPVDTDTTVLMNESLAVLPLTAVLKAYGATVTPVSEEEYHIELSERNYTLKPKEGSLIENCKSSYNFLWITGVNIIFEENGELMVSDTILQDALSYMGYRVNIQRDTEQGTVKITEREHVALHMPTSIVFTEPDNSEPLLTIKQAGSIQLSFIGEVDSCVSVPLDLDEDEIFELCHILPDSDTYDGFPLVLAEEEILELNRLYEAVTDFSERENATYTTCVTVYHNDTAHTFGLNGANQEELNAYIAALCQIGYDYGWLTLPQ